MTLEAQVESSCRDKMRSYTSWSASVGLLLPVSSIIYNVIAGSSCIPARK